MSIENLLTQLHQTGCQYAFYTRTPGSPPIYRANCQRFSSASIIKVPILLAWLHLERLGKVDRAELCRLDDEPQVQGAGLAWLLAARQLPFADVLLLMMTLSDNLCTNLVIHRVGVERLNHVIQHDLGLPNTALQRKLMDYEARAHGLDNWIAPEDCIRFFELVHQLPTGQRAWAEGLLLNNMDAGLFKRDIPRDTLDFYHKTGSISGTLHDWGYTRQCDIFLLTQNVTDEMAVTQLFGQLGQACLT